MIPTVRKRCTIVNAGRLREQEHEGNQLRKGTVNMNTPALADGIHDFPEEGEQLVETVYSAVSGVLEAGVDVEGDGLNSFSVVTYSSSRNAATHF